MAGIGPDAAASISWRILGLTALAMFAFAANSVLCRLALQQATIDPASFATLRLASGALMLALILRFKPSPERRPERTLQRTLQRSTPPVARKSSADWLAVFMLWAYVACFSFAYRSLSAGSGALILFGAVQLTMFSVGLWAGERFALPAWAGLALSVAGLVYLVSPGLAAPEPAGAALMTLAGIAWGVYSLRGRRVAEPLAATASNFLRATPLALMVSLLMVAGQHGTASGVALAVASGALTSGIGYVVWYAALRGLNALRAAAVQLSVPPIAALGGAWWLAEPITARLWWASLAILGGVGLVLTARSRRKPKSEIS